jgi:hypothetical protein
MTMSVQGGDVTQDLGTLGLWPPMSTKRAEMPSGRSRNWIVTNEVFFFIFFFQIFFKKKSPPGAELARGQQGHERLSHPHIDGAASS